MTKIYITPEEYAIAERNGISKENVDQRRKTYNWSIRRAITQPIQEQKGVWQKWKEVANAHGVYSEFTFYGRLRRGWSEEMAATEPPKKRGKAKA